MSPSKDLTSYYYGKIVKSLNYLEYSFSRINSMPTDPQKMTAEQLEAWDSFCARFARASDLFLSKFIKAYVLKDDPAFDGGFRDFLNRAEKLELIDDVHEWFEIRKLRNVTVHEYSDADLKSIFERIKFLTPKILLLRTELADASASK